MICAFTSKDAYNGCLTLFNKEDREHRGYICYKELSEQSSKSEKNRPNFSKKSINIQANYNYDSDSIFVICVKQIDTDVKVSVIRDTRGEADLLVLFPNLPSSQVKTVWEAQMDFTSAVFVLESVQNSHGKVIPIPEDFTAWPSLYDEVDDDSDETIDLIQNLLVELSLIPSDSSDEDEGWKIVSDPDVYYPNLEDYDNDEEENWEMVSHDNNEEGNASSEQFNNNNGKVSYRDILLKNAQTKQIQEIIKVEEKKQRVWKPTFKVLNDDELKKKVYLAREEELRNLAILNAMDEDDDSFYDFYAGTKSNAAVAIRNTSLAPRKTLHPDAKVGKPPVTKTKS